MEVQSTTAGLACYEVRQSEMAVKKQQRVMGFSGALSPGQEPDRRPPLSSRGGGTAIQKSSDFEHRLPTQGFLPTNVRSSKPPQSVASINFSQLEENSEGLLRAYKKKKNECQQLKSTIYDLETRIFTADQQKSIMGEENSQLKQKIAEMERQLRESQMREVRH